MATVLSAALQAAYLAWRQSPTNPDAVPMTGAVSELRAGDYLRGPRVVVTVFGALSGSNRTLTVTRLGVTGTLIYPDSQTIIFDR